MRWALHKLSHMSLLPPDPCPFACWLGNQREPLKRRALREVREGRTGREVLSRKWRVKRQRKLLKYILGDAVLFSAVVPMSGL